MTKLRWNYKEDIYPGMTLSLAIMLYNMGRFSKIGLKNVAKFLMDLLDENIYLEYYPDLIKIMDQDGKLLHVFKENMLTKQMIIDDISL